MTDTNRRLFLRSALGAAGLIMPWAGVGALELTGSALGRADVPVARVPFPISAEGLELRRLREALTVATDREWQPLMMRYGDLVEVRTSRPATSWSDCVEFAEIAWHVASKDEVETRSRHLLQTGRLNGWIGARRQPWEAQPNCFTQANAALIEAVLTLGSGLRQDPQMERRRALEPFIEDLVI